MLDRPALKRHYHAETFPQDGIFLLSERGHYHLSGPLYELVAPYLDGNRTSDQIVELLSSEASHAEIYYALERLEKDGFIGEADFLTPAPQAAFWSTAGLDPTRVRERLPRTPVALRSLLPDLEPFLAASLWQHGVVTSHGSGHELVLAGDYLAPELEAINQEALRHDRPWMLAKPVGSTIWIGPVFVPGDTGCWECLAQRLRCHRDLEGLLARLGRPVPVPIPHAAVPGSLTQALAQIALQTALWLATEGPAPLTSRIVTQDVLTLRSAEHLLVRRPQCAACGDPNLLARRRRPVTLGSVAKSRDRDGGERPAAPEAMLARYGHHVSPVTGVISQILPWAADPNHPLRVYVADHNFALMHDLRFFLRDGIRSNSSGKGMTDVQARASALGEGIERYSGVFRGEEARTRARLGDLGEQAIHPNDCMLFSNRQYRERDDWNARQSRFQFVPLPMDESLEAEWSPLWSLTAETFKYLPTGYLYYGYPSDHQEVRFWADSNGCAAGQTLEDAILQGFLELIERDAVAMWWYNRLRRPAVDLDSFGLSYVDRLREYYHSQNREFWVLDLTSDFGIPVCAAINRRIGHPVEDIILGFGAHLDPEIALTRALTEMNQFMPAVLQRDANGNTTYAFNDRDCLQWWRTATLADHPYLAPRNGVTVRRSDWMTQRSGDIRHDVERLVALAHGKGLEVLVLDQTRPDIGLPVAKVVVPGMRHFWARYKPGRLFDIPVAMAWLEAPTTEDQLNPVALFI